MANVRTLRDLASEALAVQDACNLSGVLFGWAQALCDLRRIDPQGAYDKAHWHTVLWADKVASLTGMPGVDLDLYSRASETALALQGGASE
jgi:hypothetical protein